LPGVTIHPVRDRLAGAGGQQFADYDPRRRPRVLASWLRELVFPDRFLLWRRAAARAGRVLLREWQPDVILASFPPASAVALALSLLRDSPAARLVLDFRDRWLGPGGYEPRLKMNRRAHTALERRAVSQAAAVVAVSDAMADVVAEEQGFDRRHVVTIPNGYEEEPSADQEPSALSRQPSAGTAGPLDIASRRQGQAEVGRCAAVSPQSAAPSFPLVIAHVGTVIARNRPDLFLHSLARLRGRECLRGVAFRFVGNLSRDYLSAAGLSPIVDSTGLVSRDEAWREMRQAQALLLLTGAYVGRWGYNAKVFEYVRSGRPVLCLEEEAGSNDRKLLERFAGDRVFFARLGDADGLAEAMALLRRHLAEPRASATALDSAFGEYGRADLAARLAQVLETVAES
jgi:glycosyltransferase involved in cell wall biosynthesis